MEKEINNKMQEAAKKLREKLTFDKIRKIPKYRNFKMAQYLDLINKIEKLSIILLESYIFKQNNST